MHSGDSSCARSRRRRSRTRSSTRSSGSRRCSPAVSRCAGSLNLQLAVKDERIWVLEANPRASRTVPFVSKVIGVSLAKVATLVLLGRTLAELDAEGLLPSDPGHYRHLPYTAVKAAVLPFGRFPGRRHDARSRDEVHRRGHGDRRRPGRGPREGARRPRGRPAPRTGNRLRVRGEPRQARDRASPRNGWPTWASGCWPRAGPPGSSRAGIPVERVTKVSEGSPSIVDRIAAGDIALVINTPFGRGPRTDGYFIRTAAAAAGVPCITTLPGVFAAVRGIEALREDHRARRVSRSTTPTRSPAAAGAWPAGRRASGAGKGHPA